MEGKISKDIPVKLFIRVVRKDDEDAERALLIAEAQSGKQWVFCYQDVNEDLQDYRVRFYSDKNMISYELAKKLKDAGFPQKGRDDYCRSTGSDGEDFVYTPTLSELIKACMKEGHHFNMGGCSFWWAIRRGEGNQKTDVPVQTGQTPEEAVANLYLALNKKE